MLNEKEKLVLETIRMRLSEKNALNYIMANNCDISPATYYRIKGRLEAQKLNRLYEIGQYGFVDQHLERIDDLEIIRKLLWENYWKEKRPYQASMILKEIRDIQPYLSAYYEATKMVIEKSGKREENIDISSLGRGTKISTNQ